MVRQGIAFKAFDGSDRSKRLGQLLRDYRKGDIPAHYPPPAIPYKGYVFDKVVVIINPIKPVGHRAVYVFTRPW